MSRQTRPLSRGPARSPTLPIALDPQRPHRRPDVGDIPRPAGDRLVAASVRAEPYALLPLQTSAMPLRDVLPPRTPRGFRWGLPDLQGRRLAVGVPDHPRRRAWPSYFSLANPLFLGRRSPERVPAWGEIDQYVRSIGSLHRSALSDRPLPAPRLGDLRGKGDGVRHLSHREPGPSRTGALRASRRFVRAISSPPPRKAVSVGSRRHSRRALCLARGGAELCHRIGRAERMDSTPAEFGSTVTRPAGVRNTLGPGRFAHPLDLLQRARQTPQFIPPESTAGRLAGQRQLPARVVDLREFVGRVGGDLPGFDVIPDRSWGATATPVPWRSRHGRSAGVPRVAAG